jgi:thiosulfate/3-mercaptopyruvate sulfurtransferase
MSEITVGELLTLIDYEDVVVLDVRSPAEYEGLVVAPCDPRAGRIPGSLGFPLDELLAVGVDDVVERIGVPSAVRVVAYCHSGQRSAYAVGILARFGYDARNYAGSWHEWSRDPELPVETG